jgi:hypothetical protein
MTEKFKIKDIRDEVFNVIINEVRKDENGKFYAFTDFSDIEFMCKKENEAFVKKKVNSLIEKLNSSTEEEIIEIMNADFQEDIYPTL